jgi:hypothetical protein
LGQDIFGGAAKPKNPGGPLKGWANYLKESPVLALVRFASRLANALREENKAISNEHRDVNTGGRNA